VLQADLPMVQGDAGRVPDIDNIPIIAGFEADQTTYLSLCVAYLYNDDGTFNSSQPGKYLAADGMCHSSYAGLEVSTGSFTMVLRQTRAIAEANVPIFFNFAVGQDTNGQPLYACTGVLEVDHHASLQLGKYRRYFEFCHVATAVSNRTPAIVDSWMDLPDREDSCNGTFIQSRPSGPALAARPHA
jgi:hypothetical protein